MNPFGVLCVLVVRLFYFLLANCLRLTTDLASGEWKFANSIVRLPTLTKKVKVMAARCLRVAKSFSYGLATFSFQLSS
jgi:hypothetical protein